MPRHFLLLALIWLMPLRFFAQSFEWRKDRPLTYTDFRGKVPAQRGMEAAVTASGMKSSAEFRDNKLKIEVASTFDSQKSWMAAASRNPYILNHEQRHFDITEIFTRRMRQRMNAEIRTPEDLKSKFRPVWDEVYRQYEKFQDEYDARTRHGLNPEVQQKYNTLIDSMLKETAE